jgi:DNA replication protein DnaC
MNNTLKQHARTLRLSGLLESLELRLQEAEANRLPHAQFLELLFQDEINVRHQRMINRRHKLADFREVRSLDNFDFSFNPNTNRAQIYELATGHFVAQRRDVLLVGPPGVGKSHLVQAIGREVLKAGFLVLYRSIFDLVRLGFWVLLRPGGPYFDRRDLAMIGPMLRHAGRHNGRRGGRFRLLPGIKPAVAAKSRTG